MRCRNERALFIRNEQRHIDIAFRKKGFDARCEQLHIFARLRRYGNSLAPMQETAYAPALAETVNLVTYVKCRLVLRMKLRQDFYDGFNLLLAVLVARMRMDAADSRQAYL